MSAGASVKDAQITQSDIRAAERIIEDALRPRALPIYPPDERFALAILAADSSRRQRINGIKGRAGAVAKAQYRKDHVNLMLRYVVDQKYRDDPKVLGTIMEIIRRLDEFGIEASDTQVRRDINASLKLGPLPAR